VVEISLSDCVLPVSFTFTKESWFDKIAKRLGLAAEHQTQDREFDRQCYITCDDSNFISTYLTSDRRRTLLSLFRFGVQQVRYDHLEQKLLIYSSSSLLQRRAEMDQAQTLINASYNLLGQSGESATGIPSSLPKSHNGWRRAQGIGAAAGLCLVWYGTRTAVFLNEPIWSHAGILTIIVSVAYAGVLTRARGGRSGFHRSLMVRVFFVAICTFLLGAPVLKGLNCAVDYSTETEQTATLTIASSTTHGVLRINRY